MLHQIQTRNTIRPTKYIAKTLFKNHNLTSGLGFEDGAPLQFIMQ